MKPKGLDHPLVAVCSIGHKTHLPPTWEQSKKSEYKFKNILSKMFYVILGSSALAQYGSIRIQDVLASFLDSGRKWRRVVHLYIQSMIKAGTS